MTHKEKMENDYNYLIQLLKDGCVLSKQDMKFVQSYQNINRHKATNAGKRKIQKTGK